jgi:hypothetical protein
VVLNVFPLSQNENILETSNTKNPTSLKYMCCLHIDVGLAVGGMCGQPNPSAYTFCEACSISKIPYLVTYVLIKLFVFW